MREIKFRGFNRKNGKWLYGYYFVNRGKHFIVTDGTADPFSTCEDYIVAPGTVGQFTGLKDRNSKEIYEGDIVKFHFMTSNSCSTKLFPTEKFFGKITMNKYNHWSIFSNGMEIHIENAIKYGEVIGNIHDNPGLMEDGDDE